MVVVWWYYELDNVSERKIRNTLREETRWGRERRRGEEKGEGWRGEKNLPYMSTAGSGESFISSRACSIVTVLDRKHSICSFTSKKNIQIIVGRKIRGKGKTEKVIREKGMKAEREKRKLEKEEKEWKRKSGRRERRRIHLICSSQPKARGPAMTALTARGEVVNVIVSVLDAKILVSH